MTRVFLNGKQSTLPMHGTAELGKGLARRLGWHMPQIDRLFDLRHASRLDQIEAAARALGRQLDVRVS